MHSILALIAFLPGLCFASEIPAARSGTHWGFMPIAKFSTDQGYTIGAFTQRFDYGNNGKKPFEDLLSLEFKQASRGERGGLISFEKVGVSPMNLRVSTQVSAFKNPYEAYYGIGENTQMNTAAANLGEYYYSQTQYEFKTSARKNIAPKLDLDVGVSFDYNELSPISEQSVYENDFGAGTSYRYSTKFFLGAVVESRNSEFIPDNGQYFSSYLTIAPAPLGSQSTWLRSDTDFKNFTSLVERRWLLVANQLHYSYATGSTPIMDKARLGSRDSLRGLPMNRYLSNHSLVLRTELRSVFLRSSLFKTPFKSGAGLFVDMGKIGDNLGNLVNGKTHVGYGFSFFGSYFTDDFVGCLDVGFSEGNTAIYANLNHAF